MRPCYSLRPPCREGATVEEVERAGLFHQTHYSNFYHMFSEVRQCSTRMHM